MEKLDPLEVARYEQDRAQNRLLIRRQNRDAQPPEQAAFYLGYDAEQETHLVQQGGAVTDVGQLLTNAGLSAGQPVELLHGALDSMPVVRSVQPSDPVRPTPEPRWVMILKHRRYTQTVAWTFPPRPPIFSGAQIAKWFVTYRSANGDAPEGWPDTTYGPALYTEGRSEELCGDGRPGIVGNFCRLNMSQRWNYRPEPLVQTRRPGFCHLSFAKTVPTGFDPGSGFPEFAVISLGGLVIGALAESPDGESAPPGELDGLPRVFESIDGQTCEQGYGAEVPMNWIKVANHQLVPYSPPQLIDPGHPGGVVPVDRFETVFWGVTQSGVRQLAVVADDYSDEDPGGIEPSIEVLPAIDGNSIALDLIVRRPEVERIHTVDGRPVERSNSWRRLYANGQTGTPAHPCISVYQANSFANLAEQELLLYQATGLQSNREVTVTLFRLTAGVQSCQLSAPVATITVQVPPVSPALIGQTKDRLETVGFVYFSEGD